MSTNPKTSQADQRTKPDAEAPRHEQDFKKGLSEGDARTQPSNAEKDPDHWTTGKESMTGAQASYLQTLSEEAGEPVESDLTKAEASKKIDELQQKTGRGRNH